MINLTVITRAGIYARTWPPDEITQIFDPDASLATVRTALEALGYRVTALRSCDEQVQADVELAALPDDRLTFIMHDLAVRQQIDLAIDYDELAALLGEVQHRRAAMKPARDVVTFVPTAATDVDEAAIVERAVELATDICAATREVFVPSSTALKVAVGDRALLAKAITIMADRFDKLDSTPPTVARCAWCWLAADDAPDVWATLPRMPFDEIRDHIMTCEHGPVASLRRLKNQVIAQRDARIQELLRDFVRLTQEHPETAAAADARVDEAREEFVRLWTQRLNIREDELDELLRDYARLPAKAPRF